MHEKPKFSFGPWFEKATGNTPYPFQVRFANEPNLPELVDIPTGMGKTAMVVLGWLWRRQFHEDASIRKGTPRRLVYCLPMRVLVEQTVESAKASIEALVEAQYISPDSAPKVYTLMGGDIDKDWDAYPEADAILIGTQDQLLSRALNRGYAMSRYRWPMHYGLLNNDSLWVMDEIQLMGVGVTTTAQLQAFREQLGTWGPTKSLWMSATLKIEGLKTVDFEERAKTLQPFALLPADKQFKEIIKRVNAKKILTRAQTEWKNKTEGAYAGTLAEEVHRHHQHGTLTLVIVNRVNRAQDVFLALQRKVKSEKTPPDLCLIHSRFRQAERKQFQHQLKEMANHGGIVVATQAIEAGVDISAHTLFSELAPWSSLVQRFGRCNRYGEWDKDHPAKIFWIDLEIAMQNKKGESQPNQEAVLPYTLSELEWAKETLGNLTEVGAQHISKIIAPEKSEIVHVLRRRDLLDLFDTTPDLAGNDIDVSRYIRDGENNDVQVYWRTWEGKGNAPSTEEPATLPEELCAVSIGQVKKFLKKGLPAFRWDGLDRQWVPVTDHTVWPGLTVLLHVSMGGYSKERGWTGSSNDQPNVISLPQESPSNEGFDENRSTHINRFVTLTEHSTDVFQEMLKMQAVLDDRNVGIPWKDMLTGCRWHDLGKAHEAFETMLLGPLHIDDPRRTGGPWAKSDHRQGKLGRKYFRHELASALALLKHKESDLAAYLAAAHHGKVRMSIRSLPDETIPPDGRRFARGIWEGDTLPAVDLGEGVITQALELTLSYMEMGEGPDGPSWLERTLRLREQYGPFKLAWMETLVRIADWRGTKKEEGEKDA